MTRALYHKKLIEVADRLRASDEASGRENWVWRSHRRTVRRGPAVGGCRWADIEGQVGRGEEAARWWGRSSS